ncbi:hypothetical protein EYV94_28175 [Puteibacter caeruleilacunae]|nr:hypothetical protein EYV94_28175 [Puteibacter caeruleilacunae]
MKILIKIILVVFVTSCMIQSKISNIEVFKFKGVFLNGNRPQKKCFFINVPPDGQMICDETFTGDYHKECRIIYKDSSIIYLSNDEWRGSSLNTINKIKDGIDGYTKEHLWDSLYFEGQQNDGRFWKECVLGEIVVGYVNCPLEKKEMFDISLKTLRAKRATPASHSND